MLRSDLFLTRGDRSCPRSDLYTEDSEVVRDRRIRALVNDLLLNQLPVYEWIRCKIILLACTRNVIKKKPVFFGKAQWTDGQTKCFRDVPTVQQTVWLDEKVDLIRYVLG